LAVGVCRDDGKLTGSCGTDATARKPELAVKDACWLTRAQDGQPAVLSGTSAAVAIASGIAALWIERLLALGVSPDPALVRAALLAGALPSRDGPQRRIVGSPFLAGCSAVAHVANDTERLIVRCRADGGAVRIAGVARVHERPLRWIPKGPIVTVVAAAREARGARWAVLDLEEVAAGRELEVELTATEGARGIALVVVGATALAPVSRQTPVRSAVKTILGVSASHDASACILRDGHVEVAIPLERITRKKHDGAGFLGSTAAAAYCLDALGLRPTDVDQFAFNSQPLIPNWIGLAQPVADEDFQLFDPLSDRAWHVSHHLAHAAAAFVASGFDRATVLVCDGSGGSVVGDDDHVLNGPALHAYLRQPLARRPPLHVASCYRFDRSGFRLAWREDADSFNVRCGSSSIGETYAAVSNYIFGSWQASGKVMGLAPYGDADAYGPSLLERDRQGRLQFGFGWKLAERRALRRPDPMEHRHLAARVQVDFEHAILDRVRAARRESGRDPLVLTGGLALNCRANQRIAEEVGSNGTFFFPASHDGGTSVGAAIAVYARMTGRFPNSPIGDDFLGYAWQDADFVLALRQRERRLTRERYSPEEVARRLAAGKIVGWFDGGAEFGPRALGHRSILADPRRAETWKRVNADVKFREDFRPFAPIVTREDACRFFELEGESPFMMRAVRVRPEARARLGAVCHVDGTARVQTVAADRLPRLHALLRCFEAATGLPILLNTSLNRRGEPLVETPLEAIDLLLATNLDALVLGDELVEPWSSGRPELARTDLLALSPGASIVCRTSVHGISVALETPFRDPVALPQCFERMGAPLTIGVPLATLLAKVPEPDRDLAEALLLALERERHLGRLSPEAR
jgi:carbamoyltransferase